MTTIRNVLRRGVGLPSVCRAGCRSTICEVCGRHTGSRLQILCGDCAHRQYAYAGLPDGECTNE